MPLLPELLQYVRGDARLHEDVATNDARTGIRDRESRSFQRGLDAHAVVDEIGDELSVSQWLIRTAHDSEANVDVPSFHECGNNGLEGSFPTARPPMHAGSFQTLCKSLRTARKGSFLLDIFTPKTLQETCKFTRINWHGKLDQGQDP